MNIKKNKIAVVNWVFAKFQSKNFIIANDPRMVHGSNLTFNTDIKELRLQLLKRNKKYKLLRNTNDSYETTKIQETERN